MNVFANTNFEFRMTPRRLIIVRRVDDKKILGAFKSIPDLTKCVTRSDDTAESRNRFRELLASIPPIHRREKPCHQQRRQQSEREWRNIERAYQQLWDMSDPVCRICGADGPRKTGCRN